MGALWSGGGRVFGMARELCGDLSCPFVESGFLEFPGETETPEAYAARLADALVLEFVGEEFHAGRVKPPELHGLFERLGSELVNAPGEADSAGGPSSGWKKIRTNTSHPGSSLFARWSDEAHAERLWEAFWAGLPPRETAAVLRSREAWCVPVTVLRHHLERLADASREARLVLLNYAQGLESAEVQARRAVAAGLVELYPLLERIWPHQLPEELSRGVIRAFVWEASPGGRSCGAVAPRRAKGKRNFLKPSLFRRVKSLTTAKILVGAELGGARLAVKALKMMLGTLELPQTVPNRHARYSLVPSALPIGS